MESKELQVAIAEKELIKNDYYKLTNEINEALLEIKHKKEKLYKLNCKFAEAVRKVSDITLNNKK